MKFGKQLAAQQIPAWDVFYVDYKGLKKIINSLAKGRPADAALLAAGLRPPFHLASSIQPEPPRASTSRLPTADGSGVGSSVHDSAAGYAGLTLSASDAATSTSAASSVTPSSISHTSHHGSILPDSGESALLQAHKAAFFFKLERELEKINAFYLQKESEMKSRVRALIDKRKAVQAHLGGTLSRDSACFIALYEGLRYFERDLSKLQNYIEMNATGFRKILKKWDKRSKSTTKELYLARQVDVQPCFNREVISELSDTAAANIRKLENLCLAKGGEQTVDPAADGILSERRQDLALANAEAQDDLLSNLENELIAAVKAGDRPAVEAIFSNLPTSYESLDHEIKSQLARIFWRAAIIESAPARSPRHRSSSGSAHSASTAMAPAPGPEAAARLIRVDKLDFSFVDDINGRTPLIEAAARDKADLVKVCVERGVPLQHRDVYGRQAIHYAATHSSDTTAYLLEHGADASSVDLDGSSPLIQAIQSGQLANVQVILQHLEGKSIQDSGATGHQSRASTANRPKTAESVLPIALAAKQGHVSIVSLLLSSGHPIAADASGFLPHHIAAREGHHDVLAVLLNAGASIDAADKFANWTPLFHAANEGHLASVRLLLDAGADVEVVDDQGKTAIHHAAWSGHPEIVSALLQARRPKLVNGTARRGEPSAFDATSKSTSAEPSSTRKRTAADVAASDLDDMDLDGDLIPDLSLPPPALPLRTYGHSYLDSRRSLVQITLGHPTTSMEPVPPTRFYRQDQPASLKLVITSQQDSFNAPHTVMLPQADERETISLLVDSLASLTLQLELYPTFGSRLIGKAVCLPSTFRDLKSIGRFSAPVLDTHLGIIGEVNFEINFITQFQDVQLAIGGRLETYWKSISPEKPSPQLHAAGYDGSGGAKSGNAQDQAYITASSLSGEYAKVVVQVTRDGVPFIYPQWLLPTQDSFELHLTDVTAKELAGLARTTSRSLDQMSRPTQGSRARDWYVALSTTIAPLSNVFAILPDEIGLNIEVRYPTRSDSARLGIRDPPELNASIDAILSIVYAHTTTHTGGAAACSASGVGFMDVGLPASTPTTRRILFSSFCPAACAVLNWKQPNYAVLFASYCGLSRSTPEGMLQRPNRLELDKRCTSIEGAVKFAKTNNLLGVLFDSTIVTRVPSLIDSVKENGLLLGLFGPAGGPATGSAGRELALVDITSTSEGVLSAKATEG